MKKGVKTGIADAVAAAGGAPPKDEAEQLPLLDAERGLLPPAGRAAPGPRGWSPVARPKGRRGRAPGSKNRTSTEWRDFLLKRHTSPLESLMSIQGMHWRDLAAELGLDPEKVPFDKALELLKLQVTCALGVAPYIHSKMPLAIAVDNRGYVSLTIESTEAVARMLGAQDVADGALTIEGELGELVEHATGGAAGGPSSDEKPGADPAPLASQESEENQ